MTATDELRRMLDERGVEWRCGSPNKTKWSHDGIDYVATNAWPRNDETRTKVALHSILTPEQAIAATLGAGTCHIDVRNCDWYCDACGEMVGTCDPASELFIDGNAIDMWKYCPFCGRRIEHEHH